MNPNTRVLTPNISYQPILVALCISSSIGLSTSTVLAAQDAASTIKDAAISAKQNHFIIPAQPLDEALILFEQQSKLHVTADHKLIEGKRSSSVNGRFSPEQALSTLLIGTGLRYHITGATVSLVANNEISNGAIALPPVTISAETIRESSYGPIAGYTAKRSATGSKTDTPIIEVPQSISVVTADRVEAIGATSLKEALSYTPGINAAPWGNDSQYDWVYLRGFDAYSPGFYIDGLPLRNGGSWAVWQTENYGVERIEYLRGPSSVLYGQNSAGGLINVVNKRPTDSPLHELQTQIGSNNRKQIAADLSGPVNNDRTWLYRLTALGRDAELSVGDDLPNDRTYIAPAVTWQPSDNTRVTLLSQYLDMEVASNWSSFPAEGTLLPNPNGNIPSSTFLGEPNFSRYDQKQWMVGYLLEHTVSDRWTVRQNARYGKFDTDYQTFYSARFVTVNTDTPNAAENFRLLDRTPFGSYESARQFTLDNHVEAKWQAGRWQHTALFGVDYQHTDFNVTAFWGGTVDPIDAYNPIYGSEVTLVSTPFINGQTDLFQTGIYLQDQIKFDNHWIMALGGRFDHAIVENDDLLSNTNRKQSDDHFTGRAGLVYHADNGLAPYISYAESFSPTTTIDPTTGRPFDPETGRQYEIGLRYHPLETPNTYSIAAFDIARQNYVTNDTDFIPHNTGEVTVRGVELEALFKPLPNMNVTMAYSWTPEADVTESANPNEIGKRSFNYAEHQLSLWSDYRLNSGLQIGLGTRYTGSSYGANEAAPAKIPDTTLVDALIGYDVGYWRVAINARNLTDKVFVTNCNGTGVRCSYGETRNIIGTITFHW